MTDPAPAAKAADTVRKAECSQCSGIRNCDILGEHSDRYEDGDFEGNTTWYILKCRGCDHVFVQTVSTNSEDYDNFYEEDGSSGITYNETIKYWPALSKRKNPEWLSEYGIIGVENVESLSEAMLELYGALENDLHMLAATGIPPMILLPSCSKLIQTLPLRRNWKPSSVQGGSGSSTRNGLK